LTVHYSQKYADALKHAKIIPIFKTGEKTNISNYRPISILPCFSKLLERIMYNRLYEYFVKNNLLYQNQFGFRRGHSTEHALLCLSEKILNSFNLNQYGLGIFIDLSKAFDTVNHDILLQKLVKYGVRNGTLNWLQSYLNNREQVVFYGDDHTKRKTIQCGVPQGSILGPLLFLIYINDLKNISSTLHSILFADDTTIFYSHSCISTLFKTLNNELKYLSLWFKVNKLSLNKTKTKYLIFHKNSNALPLQLPKLYIDNCEIQREYQIKFLGIVFDEHLHWKNHIRYIENKLSKTVGIMNRVKHLLNRDCLKSMYFSFFYPYISYGNIIWGSSFKSLYSKIHKKQKHAARIISNSNRFFPSKPLMQSLRILDIYQVNIFQTILLIFKHKRSLLPISFLTFFRQSRNIIKTRSDNLNYIAPKKTHYSSAKFRGPSFWNSLPKNIKTITDIVIFKRIIFTYVNNNKHLFP